MNNLSLTNINDRLKQHKIKLVTILWYLNFLERLNDGILN